MLTRGGAPFVGDVLKTMHFKEVVGFVALVYGDEVPGPVAPQLSRQAF